MEKLLLCHHPLLYIQELTLARSLISVRNVGSNSSCFESHMQTHTEMKPYDCKQCGKAFIQSSFLTFKIHSVERCFECEECGKSFSYSSHLSQHERTCTGEKPYKYKKCRRAFSISLGLIVHTRTHTGERPFECKEYRKAFTQPACLTRHLTTKWGKAIYRWGMWVNF